MLGPESDMVGSTVEGLIDEVWAAERMFAIPTQKDQLAIHSADRKTDVGTQK